MHKTLLSALVLCLSFASTTFAQDRNITNIAGDVYRFQNKFHYSIFVITGDGVVVTDPINSEAAAWLSDEIGKRTDQPITHIIYSHSHGDHASGGAAFGEVSTVVAQADAPEAIDGVMVTQRIEQATAIAVGDKTFELTPLGPGHGDDLMAIVVRPENVGFIVDAVATKRLPYQDFGNADVDAWINQVQTIEGLDFEILAGGHGAVGVKEDVTLGRVYMEELRAAVLEGLKAGKSSEQLVESVTMDAYKDWGSYEQWRALNVEGMARHLEAIGAAK